MEREIERKEREVEGDREEGERGGKRERVGRRKREIIK